MSQILVVDDEASFRESLLETLGDLGHEALGVGSVKQALETLNERAIDVIFVDYRMPEIDGLEAIRQIRARKEWAAIPIVMITAHFTSANTISAMKLGAFDYLTKPIGRKDVEEILGKLIRSSPASEKGSEVNKFQSNHSGSDPHAFVGESTEVRDVLKMIGKLAASDSSVLITGETGTGKEVVARAIHKNSDRGNRPFLAINCAAIPEALLESELFGHVKGAFTGANTDRLGSFRQAEGGSLLLDEIGDMPLPLQAKLLRTLQEKEITPLGSSKAIKINVRFLAATHQDLKEMVTKKAFREDLFYRLNVIELHLPALRARPGDILLLARYFLNQLGSDHVGVKALSQAAVDRLVAHSWPGNVRELRNVMERAHVISSGTVIEAGDIRFLTEPAAEVAAFNAPEVSQIESLDLPSAVAKLERRLIQKALEVAKGNRSEAARQLGIQRQLLYTKMKEYRLDE